VEIAFDNVGAAWEGATVKIGVIPVDGGDARRELVRVAPRVKLTVPTGKYHVIVRDERGREIAHQVAELREGGAVTCRLPDGCRVRGTITTAHGEPYVGTVALGDIECSFTADDAGEFDAGFVPAGRDVVMLVTGAGIVHAGHVEVPCGAEARIAVVVRGTARFHGWFVNDEGGVRHLSVSPEEESEPAVEMWTAGGAIGVGCLQPGAYVLRGDGVAEVRFVLHADRDVDIGNVIAVERAR
jgi:hypothetical protein